MGQALLKEGSGTEKLRSRAIKKFLHYFPDGFQDETYRAWERDYKWEAHLAWKAKLNEPEFARLIRRGDFMEIASRAARVESRTNPLFSFEKMALRDTIKDRAGAQSFAVGLYEYLYGSGTPESRFTRWAERVAELRRQPTASISSIIPAPPSEPIEACSTSHGT